MRFLEVNFPKRVPIIPIIHCTFLKYGNSPTIIKFNRNYLRKNLCHQNIPPLIGQKTSTQLASTTQNYPNTRNAISNNLNPQFCKKKICTQHAKLSICDIQRYPITNSSEKKEKNAVVIRGDDDSHCYAN